jgi:hypothetical protein
MLPTHCPPTHPGEMLLKEFLEPLGVSQVDAAKRMNIPFQRLNAIVRGRRSLRGGERVAPPQAREAREVAVGRDEFAPMLDGQRRDVGIRDQGALDVATETGEELPVPATRRDERSARPVHQALAEGESRVHRRGRIEDARIGDDAQESREDDVRQGERFIRGRQRLQPPA